ncbi:MAG TPA: hypothetical protein VGI88_02610 [Verrucomicrobiae bacterium]|jgi:outer membrane lipoprotein SlyB
MKTLNTLAALAALIIGAGCQSNQNHASNDSYKSQQAANKPENYNVTIESIPANRLSPTSREGDKLGAVYSSNIIAVYVNQVGKTNGGVTNLTATSISSAGMK